MKTRTYILFSALFLLAACSRSNDNSAVTLSPESQEGVKLEVRSEEKKAEALSESQKKDDGHWDKAGHEIKEGFKETGHDIKEGSQKAGHEMKKGFQKAGHEIKNAFD